MKKYTITLLLFLCILLLTYAVASTTKQQFPKVLQSPSPQVLGNKEQTVLVRNAIDGDTVEIEGGTKVRYIGIDTPETKDPRKDVQCFGQEATEKNKELVEGRRVRLEKDVSETDKFGRLLRYVYINNTMVNDYLVRNGYAVAASFPPDVKYQQQFIQAQREARENNRGLWTTCENPFPPEGWN